MYHRRPLVEMLRPLMGLMALRVNFVNLPVPRIYWKVARHLVERSDAFRGYVPYVDRHLYMRAIQLHVELLQLPHLRALAGLIVMYCRDNTVVRTLVGNGQ